MSGFIDIHQHVVYGVDDGPKNFEDAKKMLEYAAKDGVTHIVSTAHFRVGFGIFDVNGYAEKIDKMNEYCSQCNLGLKVHTGAEIFYSQDLFDELAVLEKLTLAKSRSLLVEFDWKSSYMDIYCAVHSLSLSGFVPILAHVERYKSLMKTSEHIRELREQLYAKIQVNCESILDIKHGWRWKAVTGMLKEGLIDYIASDAHDTMHRKSRMNESFLFLKEHYGLNCAEALTAGNQSEIIFGGIR